MLPVTSSVRLFVFICCIMTITSFKIVHHPLEDRNERAVTEWRFRRNFLLPIPFFYPNYDDHLRMEIEENENENNAEMFAKQSVPNTLYDRMNE